MTHEYALLGVGGFFTALQTWQRWTSIHFVYRHLTCRPVLFGKIRNGDHVRRQRGEGRGGTGGETGGGGRDRVTVWSVQCSVSAARCTPTLSTLQQALQGMNHELCFRRMSYRVFITAWPNSRVEDFSAFGDIAENVGPHRWTTVAENEQHS